MRSLPYLLCIAILMACQQPVKQPVTVTLPETVPETVPDTMAERRDPLIAEQGNDVVSFQSTLFKQEDIYGAWANSSKDTICSYKITPHVFIHCDRGESGIITCDIVEDVMFFYEANASYEAKILKADNDTLIIKWEGIDTPDVKVRMKN